MVFTKEAVTIHGGCNCKAVRYEVSAPPFEDRPPTPYRTPGVDVGDLRIPCVLLCHCNDCRRGTASTIPMGLVAEQKSVKASVLPRSEVTDGPFALSDDKRDWEPASQIFDFENTALKDTYLSFYRPARGRSRWFCSRCGVPIAYSIDRGMLPPECSYLRELSFLELPDICQKHSLILIRGVADNDRFLAGDNRP